MPFSEFIRYVRPVGVLPARPGWVPSRGGGLEEDDDRPCSEQVEGRDVASHLQKGGNMWGLAKARSIALGLWEPEKRKWV